MNNPSITSGTPRLQESPILSPSINTPPPSQETKGNRKRKSFRDSGYFGTPDGPDTSFEIDVFKIAPMDEEGISEVTLNYVENKDAATKRPRLDAALSESRIIPKAPPHSFHNLSIVSPPPSSSPQGAPAKFITKSSLYNSSISNYKTYSRCPSLDMFSTNSSSITSRRYKSLPLIRLQNPLFSNHHSMIHILISRISPAKFPQFHDGPDDVVLRYAYGSPAKRETKRRNYWRRLHSGFDPADIDGEADADATEVYGVDLGYMYRASLQKENDEKGNDEDDEADTDYQEEEHESETESSEDSDEDDEDDFLGSLEWGKEHEEAFNELSPP